MAAFFSKDFIQYLAEELSCDPETVQTAILNYTSGKTPSSSKKEKVSSSKKEEDDTLSFIKKNAGTSKKKESSVSSVSSSVSSKKCQRIPRGKTEICGKAAKNKVEDNGEEKWYCGTEKSGCYSSVISALGKKEKNTRDKKSSPTVIAPTPKKNPSEIKSQSLVHKIIQTEKITTKGIMVDGKKLFMHPDTRILFNRDKKAYGELSKDDKTILPISDKNIRWLEATNTFIEDQKKEEEEEETDVEEDTDKDTGDEEEEEETDEDEEEETDEDEEIEI